MSYSTACVQDIACDCAGNFYLLRLDTGNQWMHKYSSTGTLLQSWTISGASADSYGNGLAIIGNHVYYNNSTGFWDGLIGSTNVSFTLINASGIQYGTAGFATCAFGAAVATTNFDTIRYCAGGVPDTLVGYGTDTLSWAVLSGPATLSGSGDTVTVSTTGNARLVLSSTATAICGSNKDTVQLLYVPAPSAISNSPVCAGDSLKLYATDTATGISWQWGGPLNFNDTLQSSYRYPVLLADSGDYIVSINTTDCSLSDTIHVVVNPVPATPIASSNSPLCAGDSLKLTVSNSQLGISYQWAGPGSFFI